jgi:acetyltransferase-like isoleucine patch superfamily enzyme
MNGRKLDWDWYDGMVPENVVLEEQAYLETSYSFLHFRSRVPEAVRIGHGSTIYLGCMFDLGANARVQVGRCSLVNGAWIICDSRIEIGEYALIAWNVVLMDSYRAPFDPKRRSEALRRMSRQSLRRLVEEIEPRPIRIERNVWIGFDSCVLPGVTIGEGAIVGARSVVAEDVPPYTLAAGNPARVIREIKNDTKRELIASI